MNFFRKKKPKFTTITSIKQIKSHLREFILDSQIPDADLVSLKLGCTPISDELLEREEAESDLRIEKISILIPLLYGYSTLFAEAFVSNLIFPDEIASNPNAKKFIEQIVEETQHTFEDAMAHLLIGTVSQLIDLELLNMPKERR